MTNIIETTTLENPALEAYARLTEGQLRSRQEPEKGIFIAEGLTVIGHALDAGCEPLSFLMERKHITGKARDALTRCEGVPVYTADSAVLEKLTGFALTRGVLCAMRRPRARQAETLCRDARRVAVLVDLVDPTNVGAAIRNAAALGMDAVLLSLGCCDPLNRRAIRVSMGTVFQIPWATLPLSGAEGIRLMQSWGFQTAAMALDDRAVNVTDNALGCAEKLAVVLGTEGSGLPDAVVAACDHTVCIPMSHGVDSLNVAAASAIAFFVLGSNKD